MATNSLGPPDGPTVEGSEEAVTISIDSIESGREAAEQAEDGEPPEE